MSPIITLALIPSSYVSAFRIQSPLGELRPSFILLFVCIVFFLILHVTFGKINVTIINKYKLLLWVNFLFFVVNIISIVANDLTFGNFRYALFNFAYSWGIILLVCLVSDKVDTFKVIKSTLKVSTIVCIIGLVEFVGFQPLAPYYLMDNEWYNYIRSSGRALPRIVSTIGNPLVFSAYLLYHIPLILYLREISLRKGKWNIILLIHCLTILLTQSRSAFVILIAIVVLFNLKRLKSLFKNMILALVAGLLFLGLLSIFGMSEPFIDRLLFKTEGESITIRYQAFSVSYEILQREGSLIGIGTNMVNHYLQTDPFMPIPVLDNLFLQVVVSLGIVGLITFFACLYTCWRYFRKLDGKLRNVGISLLLVTLGTGFSFNTLSFESVWGVFWFITAILILHDYKEKLKQNEQSDATVTKQK